ncbi:MAG: phage terminase small subunit P27 family [Clostridium sp.]
MGKKITCPTWIDAESKKEWKRIVKLLEAENKDFTQKDIKALEGYCLNYSKWKKCELILEKKGLTFTTPNGYEQQRPEISIANKAQGEMRSWMKELGITPAARSRMMKGSPQNLNDQFDSDMEDMISHG